MIKKSISLTAIAAAMLVTACQSGKQAAPAIPADPKIEARISEILSKMSLEDKVGQMCELAVDLYTDYKAMPEFKVDQEKLEALVKDYRIGSFLNVPQGVAATPEVWNSMISDIQKYSMEHIGIPDIYGVDQNHGASYTAGATYLPQPINMAASFNTELARIGGEICAYETRACGIPWTYNPTLDLTRNPNWSRAWENYGESEVTQAKMGEAVVRGMQGDDPNHIDLNHIAVCVKHYLCYGTPVSGKDRTPAIVAPHEIKEKFFAPYKKAIEAGALSIMVNSASINGEPVHASHRYLTEWLKEGLNWDGMIVTDWADIDNLWKREKIATDKKDAIRIAINAGIDMSMDPYDPQFCTLLAELVREGKVSQERIDDAVSRILRLKLRLGLFENPTWDISKYPKFASDEFATASKQAAQESMVLLKNEKAVLPIKKGSKILVCGPNANSMRCLNGGWSYSWQGDAADRDDLTGQYNTILEALKAKFGAANVSYSAGVEYKKKSNPMENVTYDQDEYTNLETTVFAARRADIVVCCIGENSYCETPGNLNELTISEKQLKLVKAVAATGKPVVLILNEGRARIIRDIVGDAAAIVDIMLPSNYGGDALAELLAGEANFSGKLPFTYPKYTNSLVCYDHKPSEHTDGTMEGAYNYNAVVSSQWAFGYGLSYTSFGYSNLKVDKEVFGPEDVLNICVDVTNTGEVEGKESVLLFSSDLVASLTPDVRRLRDFSKVSLAPGETKTVSFCLPAQSLAFVNQDLDWTLESGEFKICIGDQYKIITLK